MGSINDHGNCALELTDFRYGIQRNSMVVRARFRSPFVVHSLDHGRLHVFSLCCLDTIVTIVIAIIYYYCNYLLLSVTSYSAP